MTTTPVRTQIWTGMKWLLKAFLVMAVIGVLFLPLFLMATPNLIPTQLEVPKGIGTAWLTVVGVVAALCVVYISWRIVRALLLYPLGSWQVFGTTTRDRLLGLGVAALLVPKAVAALILTPATLLLQLLDRLPRQTIRIPISVSSMQGSTYTIKEPIVQLCMMTLDAVSEVAKTLGRAVEGIMTPEVVIALAIWAVMGNLFSSAETFQDGTRSELGVSRVRRYIQALSNAQRYGIVLACVFLSGMYLSIAAIVAIPWLQEEKVAPGLTRDGLEKMLNGILPSSTAQFDERLRSVPPAQDDPLEPLSRYLAKGASAPGTHDLTSFTVLNLAINESKNSRSKAIEQLKQMPVDIVQRAVQMKQAALNAFDMETATPMSSQERGYFMREIQRSVSSDYQELERVLKTCATTLSETDKQLRIIAQFPTTRLNAGVTATPADLGRQGEQEIQYVLLSSQLTSASQSLRDACEVPVVQRTVYTPPEPGSAWGPFGLVARWLLQTKSFALTLITGMLGFGLLGAAISTFIRGGANKDPESVLAEGTSVLVRGISAAVVVFLAVKGGLAVFATGETEPNAYVVFFTCLVGAVFSEDVWNWAHSKFLENLHRKSTNLNNEQTAADADSEKQASDDAAPKNSKTT